jgi:phenylacetate-coenzyme A ligase PaaK-like adenylate-forming protein
MKSHNLTYKYDWIFQGLPPDFNARALEVFKYHCQQNSLYRNFVEMCQKRPETVDHLNQIPFLPISFFKTAEIKTGHFLPEIVFESSGTTGTNTARHFVKQSDLYRQSFVKGFERFYGGIRGYCVLGLLPAYLERTGSSLVWMVDEMIRISGHDESGFYLYDFDKLHEVLLKLEKDKQPTLLIGVSFALLDFAEKYTMKLTHTIVMETGGMKGRKKEITRIELHNLLKQRLGVNQIHSEYGMTELLSQAYSSGNGIFKPVPWMKILVREEDDPMSVRYAGEGMMNIIDLANIDSCAFIATDDVVRLYEDGSFEVLGRMDNSDIRGCSLLVI